MAIPKIIHWCWFSEEKQPSLVQRCIKTWRKVLPDYEIKLWDARSFDFDSVPYVKQAYEHKQWAFVSDYVRLYAIYTWGGVYLDSDVAVFKRFDYLHEHNFFTGIEFRNKEHENGYIEAAIVASTPGNPLVKEILEQYNSRNFIREDGSFDKTIAPNIYTPIFKKRYGWVGSDRTVTYPDGTVILDSSLLTNSIIPSPEKSHIFYHYNNATWSPYELNRGCLFKFCKRNGYIDYYRKIEVIIHRICNYIRKLPQSKETT